VAAGGVQGYDWQTMKNASIVWAGHIQGVHRKSRRESAAQMTLVHGGDKDATVCGHASSNSGQTARSSDNNVAHQITMNGQEYLQWQSATAPVADQRAF
jgi:hypothetical protein